MAEMDANKGLKAIEDIYEQVERRETDGPYNEAIRARAKVLAKKLRERDEAKGKEQ